MFKLDIILGALRYAGLIKDIYQFNFTKKDLELNFEVINKNRVYLPIKKLIWFIPTFYHPYGGIYTIFRFAEYLERKNNINNCFVIVGGQSDKKVRDFLSRSFPLLINDEVIIIKDETELYKLQEADASFCTLWTTAFISLKFNKVKRKFYLIQDYEPLFYPAGPTSAFVEETYKFGFYGIANTVSLKNIYEDYYCGKAEFFSPAVDTSIFYPNSQKRMKDHISIFFYGRPDTSRNGFELGITALKKLKMRMGDKVRIITAGSKWDPKLFGVDGIIENIGLLDYEKTAELYRECDIGLVLMFTRHPSYIPFELMASGCLVVSNDNPATRWFLKDQNNCLLCHATIDSICSTIEDGINKTELRNKITKNALQVIKISYSNWDKEFEKIFNFMCNVK